MKRGNRIQLQIDGMSAQGDGVGWHDGREVHVQRAVPGDVVDVVIVRKRKGRLEGREVGVVSPAMERLEPFCRHFDSCGGCRWQHLSYEDQLVLKADMVRLPLMASGIDPGTIAPIVPCDEPTFYRNKMEFSFASGPEGELRLGLHVRGRYNWVFDLIECHLQSPLSNRIVEAARSEAVDRGMPAYDLRSHEGLLRFLVIREGKFTQQVMVNLVVAEYPREDVAAMAAAVCTKIPEITSFVVTQHSGKAQVARGEREFAVVGGDTIVERCGDLDYRISTQSFYQTNSHQVVALYDLVAAQAPPLQDLRVLDLYCGTGGIGLHLADQGARVLGIEQEEAAGEDARRNAAANGLEKVEFRSGRVEELIGDLDDCTFDLVVVDPPRAGLHKNALAALREISPPALLYVSCNPVTLAEDLVELLAAGYVAQSVVPVDMFPQTPHCEVVVRLARSAGGEHIDDWKPASE